jgi:hypothetical protein
LDDASPPMLGSGSVQQAAELHKAKYMNGARERADASSSSEHTKSTRAPL